MLRTLNDVPEPDDAIECHDWDNDGQRSVLFHRQHITDAAGGKFDLGVGGVQDYAGAVRIEAWMEGDGEFSSPESMREFAAHLLASADLWERLTARKTA